MCVFYEFVLMVFRLKKILCGEMVATRISKVIKKNQLFTTNLKIEIKTIIVCTSLIKSYKVLNKEGLRVSLIMQQSTFLADLGFIDYWNNDFNI